MADVLRDAMKEYFKTKMVNGFQTGKIEINSLPERVSVYGTKHLRSGVIYLVTIH